MRIQVVADSYNIFIFSARFQVPAQPRISHATMAFAYQCAGNAIPSRTAQMDPMRPANVVSTRIPMWAMLQTTGRSRAGGCVQHVALLDLLAVDCDIIGLTVWP